MGFCLPIPLYPPPGAWVPLRVLPSRRALSQAFPVSLLSGSNTSRIQSEVSSGTPLTDIPTSLPSDLTNSLLTLQTAFNTDLLTFVGHLEGFIGTFFELILAHDVPHFPLLL